MKSETTSPLHHVIDVLQLSKPSVKHDHTYITGESLYFPTGRVYGGQVIAQSVMAAAATVDSDRLPNSIHGYFITAGDIHQDVHFDVERLRDGRSFSARRVNVTQQHGAILTAIASFQVKGQPGITFCDAMPADVPAPETLPSAKDLMAPYAQYSTFANYYANQSPFDIRHVESTVMLGSDATATAHDSGRQMVWMRADGTIHAAQVVHRALLALGCDQIMMEPVIRRAGLSFMTQGISYATIDHSMWWYEDIDMSQWHLYVQDTPIAAHGRGLTHAKVFTPDGRLVAAMAQEAMVRVPMPEDEQPAQ